MIKTFVEGRSMQPKTEEFLYFLLWSADQFMRPTFRNLTDSFEAWAYRNGLFRQIKQLERRHLLERLAKDRGRRSYRLTDEGRLHALGGRDPEAQWSRGWDGAWRLVVFDVPAGQNARRERLRHYLHRRGFGCLQYSVWITPDPLDPERGNLAGGQIDLGSLLLLELRPCGGPADSQIVAGAWDWLEINARYQSCLKVLRQRPAGIVRGGVAAVALQRWAAEERETWLEAVSRDPLLPSVLLPTDYLGRTAWRKRAEVLAAAATQARGFVE